MLKRIHFRGYVTAAIALDVLTIIFILVMKTGLPPLVPLFYGRPVGEGQLSSSLGLLVAPAFAILVTMINAGLSLNMKDNFTKEVLNFSSLVISLLTTITVLKIIFLIT